MNTIRTPSRSVEYYDVNEEIPSQVNQVEQVPQGSQGAQGDQVPIVCGGNYVPMVPLELTNQDINEALLTLARTVTTHVICA